MRKVICGDAVKILAELESESIDAVITDPPYPMIKRDYGMLTVEEWWSLMIEGIVPEVRRLLKPTGSAVFILQPNSEHVGQMRGWLWEFMAWICREWNMIQDVWWWNPATIPSGVCNPRSRGLLRASVKSCVWCGSSICYRQQDAILWAEADSSRARYTCARAGRPNHPSGQSADLTKICNANIERGGVTPFNLIPIGNTAAHNSAGAYGHSAGTPLKLADWWTRYVVPLGGIVLDPFFGSGTMGVAALQNGCSIIGIDKEPQYCEIAEKRLQDIKIQLRLI